MTKKILHENQVIRKMIIRLCRIKKIKYEKLKPELKFHRSVIDKNNCFIILDLMMKQGAEIDLTEYRKWKNYFFELFDSGFKLIP
tara:strand:+ start:304 stop:558 length:255 start_codon:yes stop_codon:yes gene_type:complete